MAGSIRGMGASVSPTAISILCICVLRVTWQYTVYPLVGTVESLFISYVVSWIVAGIANAICYAVVYKRFNKKLKLQRSL